jgi:cytosine/adenosine deaminase-related metal-dependent hydrolase
MEPSITVEEIQDLIRTRAYHLWEMEGKPEGMQEQHWLAAEKEVLEEVDRSGATGPAITDTAPREVRADDSKERQDELLDEAVEETFPASDPIAPKRIT